VRGRQASRKEKNTTIKTPHLKKTSDFLEKGGDAERGLEGENTPPGHKGKGKGEPLMANHPAAFSLQKTVIGLKDDAEGESIQHNKRAVPQRGERAEDGGEGGGGTNVPDDSKNVSNCHGRRRVGVVGGGARALLSNAARQAGKRKGWERGGGVGLLSFGRIYAVIPGSSPI